FRTNLGLVEGSGNPAAVLISVFGGDGKKISEFPMTLAAGQHTQFSLASQGVNVTDGRVEVKVTSPAGKVPAYASVLDNITHGPRGWRDGVREPGSGGSQQCICELAH